MVRRFLHIVIFLGLFSEAPEAAASSHKKKSSQIDSGAATISYTWQEGDTLSSALYSVGIGHPDQTKARLYGHQGWVAKNLSFSQKTIGEWEQITPGITVTLWVPSTLKVTEKKVVEKMATNLELSAKQAPYRLEQNPPYYLQRPVHYQEVMDSLITLSPSKAIHLVHPQAKKRPIPTGVKPPQAHLEKSEEGLGMLAIIILFTVCSFGIYSLRFQRKYRNYKRMRQSANAYLARLIGAEDTMPEQTSLFEIMVVNSEDLSKSWASYEVMGYYQADCVLLSTLKSTWLDAAAKTFPYPPLPPDQFACFARFIIVSPHILSQILTLASSVALQRATLRQLVTHMMEIPPDSQKKSSMSAGLQDFLETIPKSREKLPLREDLKKCIHWLEKLPSQQPTISTQIA